MKISLSLIFIVTVFCSGSLYSNLMIAPTRLEVKLEGQATESFVVVNQSADKLKIGIEPIPFGASGVSAESAAKTDISKYISINPKVINLAAGKSRVVRVTVRADQEVKKKKGEYYARLLFKTIEKEKREITKKKEKAPKDVSMVVDLIFNVSIPVYGTVGSGTPEIKTECFIDKEGPKVRLINSGLWRFDGNLVLYSKNKDAELTKERVMMVRETSREIPIKLKQEEYLLN
ncbi:MAG: fimbria/pilus periplasmic chaperone [Proteobacteria bacterium]|nr:fimbria/pilus periplasmic chaperone [Pseudomonadota bacterium]